MNLEDKNQVAKWLGVNIEKVNFDIKMEPIDNFINQAKEALLSYDFFPKDKKRTNKILKLLKSGSPALPIYVEKDDKNNFIMEGRHRIVAFYMLGLKEIPVTRCTVVK